MSLGGVVHQRAHTPGVIVPFRAFVRDGAHVQGKSPWYEIVFGSFVLGTSVTVCAGVSSPGVSYSLARHSYVQVDEYCNVQVASVLLWVARDGTRALSHSVATISSRPFRGV